jgi:hypothetical protein
MGWRPQEEFRGPAGAWKSAEEFVRRGEEDLPLVREHNRKLEQRLMATERKLTEAVDTIEYTSNMVRSAEERAYKRAKADLEAQREAAVAAGDTQAFKRAEAEIVALEAPKPPPAKPAPQAQSSEPHPDAVAWAEQNPWFNTDPDLKREAIAIHGSLMQARPDLTLAENLRRVTATIKTLNPDKFRVVEQDGHLVDDNPRRHQAASVAASSATGGPARPKPGSFDAMPKDSKDEYARYAKLLEGKGKPLTKDEWAADYWAKE